VVVMNAGRVDQQGAPHDIYERPATRFVADFIGKSSFVESEVATVHADGIEVRALGTTLRLVKPAHEVHPGARELLVLRPEHLHVQDPHATEGVGFAGTVASVAYLGAAAAYEIALADGSTLAVHDPAPHGAALRRPGDPVRVRLDVERVYVVPAER
jgi:ABC-type Fe3+/spermidine/putrescine transport system ATPase subunit